MQQTTFFLKIISIFILTFFCTAGLGQGIASYVGANNSYFYFNESKYSDVSTIYIPMVEGCMGVFVDQSKTKAKIPSFSIQYDGSEGFIYVQSGSEHTEAFYEKTSLAFGVYLISKNFWKNFNYHAGAEIALLLEERFEGRRRNDSGGYDSISELNDAFNNPFNYFLKNQISYDFYVTERIAFRLHYAFLFGLNNEFEIEPDITKSLKHFLCVDLKYDLNMIK